MPKRCCPVISEGCRKKVGGMVFIPKVETTGVEIRPIDKIVDVEFTGRSVPTAEQYQLRECLRETYVGQMYIRWASGRPRCN